MRSLRPFTVGKHQSPVELHQKLIAAGVRFGEPWVTELLLTRLVLSTEPCEVNLVAVHIHDDMGLHVGCQYEDILAVGSAHGLKLCAMEDVFETRLAYLDQPCDEFLTAMMVPETMASSDGDIEVVLTIERMSGMGPDPWMRARSKQIVPVESMRKEPGWNPFNDPAFHRVIFRS